MPSAIITPRISTLMPLIFRLPLTMVLPEPPAGMTSPFSFSASSATSSSWKPSSTVCSSDFLISTSPSKVTFFASMICTMPLSVVSEPILSLISCCRAMVLSSALGAAVSSVAASSEAASSPAAASFAAASVRRSAWGAAASRITAPSGAAAFVAALETSSAGAAGATDGSAAGASVGSTTSAGSFSAVGSLSTAGSAGSSGAVSSSTAGWASAFTGAATGTANVAGRV